MKKILIVLVLFSLIIPFMTRAENDYQQSVEGLQLKIKDLTEKLRIYQQSQTSNAGTTQWCFNFDRNLGVGASGRDVRELYTALDREGFPVTGVGANYTSSTNTIGSRNMSENNEDGDNENGNNGTERYTEATAALVSQLQQKYASEILTPNGLSAPTGYFGPATRAKMNRLYGCSGQKPIVVKPPRYGCYPQYAGGPILCVDPPQPTQPLTVISPNGGEVFKVGDRMLIRWLSSNNDNSAFARINITGSNYYSVFSRTLDDGSESWTIPANIQGGSYQMSVSLCRSDNDCYTNDFSDSSFKIYGDDYVGDNRPPSIFGVSGPTTLKINEKGKWIVKAKSFDPENGSLSYSVWWGDEVLYSPTADGTSTNARQEISQNATFTHTYSRSGTFSPTFTVTDDKGQSARTSLSVVVGGGSGTTGIDLSVNKFELNADGPKATFCNKGSVVVSSFPVEINVHGVARSFDLGGAITPGTCNGPQQWYYATWNLSATPPSGGYRGIVLVDTNGIYAETNETNNKLLFDYNPPIIPPPISSAEVLSPNGEETWARGSTHTISWGATGAPEVSVYLTKDSDPTYRLAIRHNFVSGRANSIEWTIPGDTATVNVVPGSDYRIWVIGGGTTAVDDKSDAPFAII
jgi:hypothetical protein